MGKDIKQANRRVLLLLVSLLLLGGLNGCFMADVEFPREPTRTVTPTRTPRPTRLPTLTPIPTPTAVWRCPLPDLSYNLHISASGSYTQSQWEASGPMACRMSPRCARSVLAGNLRATIIFKKEEGGALGEEDIFVHPAMLSPLYELDKLVQAEWGGAVNLRITDAYDSLLEHDLNQDDPTRKYSLHFEGRAVDLTTWPIDQNLYPRLCALAHCAGFDWVHNEGDHCHASINAESLCTQCSQ